MFDFHYNYIKSKYGNKAELLFTDTDSLMYQIETDDFYQDIASDVRKRFDTSDYPEKHESLSKFQNEDLPRKSNNVSCKYCNCENFFIKSGCYHCTNCFVSLGHVLGYYYQYEYELFYFRKKSIYQRKCHYQNKIKEVIKKFKLVLSGDEQYQLYKKLVEINDDQISKLNEKFGRKILINIYYLIKVLINNDFLKHKQANINVKSRRFGIIVTPFSRQNE